MTNTVVDSVDWCRTLPRVKEVRRIRNKAEFYRLWEAGVLGNRTNIWHDPARAHRECKNLEIGFRQIGKAGGGKWEKVPRDEVFNCAARWSAEGRKFIMDDGAPDWCRTLQGEVCRTYRGLEGYLDTVGKLPMRPAMAAGHMRMCSGATIRALLDRFMDPSSQEDLAALLDLFPDATVEFSCFGIDVGVFLGRNTIFWETRDY